MKSIIGTVTCTKDINPVPGSSGWHITAGKEYKVLEIYENWLIIIADDGKEGSYSKHRFTPM